MAFVKLEVILALFVIPRNQCFYRQVTSHEKGDAVSGG